MSVPALISFTQSAKVVHSSPSREMFSSSAAIASPESLAASAARADMMVAS